MSSRYILQYLWVGKKCDVLALPKIIQEKKFLQGQGAVEGSRWNNIDKMFFKNLSAG